MRNVNRISTKLFVGVTIILTLWIVHALHTPSDIVQAKQITPPTFDQSLSLTGFGPASTLPAARTAEEGLVAYYPFHGQANDASGHHNDAAVSGPVLTTNRFGQANDAYLFDGIDDFMSVADNASLDIRDHITLAAWIFPKVRKSEKIMVKGEALHGNTAAPFGLSLSGSGDIIFSLRPDLQFTQLRRHGYSLNQWLFIVGTYDGSTMKLYIDGSLANTQSITGLLNSNDDALLIGTRLKLRSDTFNGKIDDIRIYNRALSAREVQTLYAAGNHPLSLFLPVILK